MAAGRDPAELAAWVRHQIATHCEPALEAEAERGRAKRYLQTSRDADGTLRGRFVLATEDCEAVTVALEALSRRQGLADDRSAGQRRADALVEVCEQVLRHGKLPEHGGQRPQLSYLGKISLRDLHVPWIDQSGGADPPGSSPPLPRPASDDPVLELFRD